MDWYRQQFEEICDSYDKASSKLELLAVVATGNDLARIREKQEDLEILLIKKIERIQVVYYELLLELEKTKAYLNI